MGAWSESPFDNDDAGDWSYDFDEINEAAGLRILADALDLADPAEYLEAPEGSIAIAAALVVSWLLNPDGIADSPYGEAAATWVRSKRPTASRALRTSALAALDRVRADQSELADLWAEADGATWFESLTQIESQLG